LQTDWIEKKMKLTTFLIKGLGVFAMASALVTSVAFCSPQTNDAGSVPLLHSDTRVVQIEVVVTDSRNNPVTGLSQSDFIVTDNGKLRMLGIFAISGEKDDRGAVQPTTASMASAEQSHSLGVYSNHDIQPPNLSVHSTVLILDQVNAYLEDAAYARQQVINLLKLVEPDERIILYVMSRNEGLVLLQDSTTDRRLLLGSLNKYIPRGIFPSPPDSPSQANKSGDTSGVGDATTRAEEFARGIDQPNPPGLPNLTPSPGIREKVAKWEDNSAQARQSLQFVAAHLALLPGRKSVYWITQGFPPFVLNGTQQPAWSKTIADLNDANVAVNVVDSRGLFRGANPSTGTISTMQEIAERTGGQAYFGRNDLDTAMAQGIAASRVTYTLGFYLSDQERDSTFHTLGIGTKRTGLQLYYRHGYYAGNPKAPDGESSRLTNGDLEAALSSDANLREIGITAKVGTTPGTAQATANIELRLDPAAVELEQRNSGWVGKIDEILIEQSESGEILAKISDTREFEVPVSGRVEYDTKGVSWPLGACRE